MANKISKVEWEKAQEFEAAWWETGINTLGEELKQMTYARKMGLKIIDNGRWFVDAQNKSVIDIGGGIVSLLLKCTNLVAGNVIEPMGLPGWALYRYESAKIGVSRQPAEEASSDIVFDEVWIYNVLQHTYDPKQIIENAKKMGKIIRIFEWIDTPPHEGHPQTLTKAELDEWLGGTGRVEEFDPERWGGYNRAYYGVFTTANYDGDKDL